VLTIKEQTAIDMVVVSPDRFEAEMWWHPLRVPGPTAKFKLG